MEEPEQTTAQLRTELAALRQRNAHLEAAMARRQLRVDSARSPALLHEVTAARQRYHDLFHFAPDGYLVTSLPGTILEANAAAAVLLNVAPQRLIGKPFAVFVARPDRQTFRTRLHELVQVERHQAWEICLQPRQQALVPVELTVRLMHNTQGDAGTLLWLLRDITVRKRVEEALQQAHAALEQRVQERTAALHHEMAERQRAEEERHGLERDAQRAQHFAMLGQLAAGVSHEIRNPLGAIFLHVDLLEEALHQPTPDSPADIAQALAEIKAQLARLDDLVQDYLSLVRVASYAADCAGHGSYRTGLGRRDAGTRHPARGHGTRRGPG